MWSYTKQRSFQRNNNVYKVETKQQIKLWKLQHNCKK